MDFGFFGKLKRNIQTIRNDLTLKSDDFERLRHLKGGCAAG